MSTVGTPIAFESIQTGDKIRVVYRYKDGSEDFQCWEGVVTNHAEYSIRTRHFYFDNKPTLRGYYTYELLERPEPLVRKLVVGDVIETPEEANTLPPGSAARRPGRITLDIRDIDGQVFPWVVSISGGRNNHARMIGATVVYIPTDAEVNE